MYTILVFVDSLLINYIITKYSYDIYCFFKLINAPYPIQLMKITSHQHVTKNTYKQWLEWKSWFFL